MALLRSSSRLARLVLAWFALTLGVAAASPLIHPQALQLVCGDGPGARLVAVTGDGQAIVDLDHRTLDCLACLGTTLPPPAGIAALPSAVPAAHLLQPWHAAPVAVPAGAPLPPRGPPARA